MIATEEINEWVEKYGSERDALNVALAKLLQAEKELAQAGLDLMGREKDLEEANVRIDELRAESNLTW